MLLSVADARPRNIETVRSRDLVPSALQTNAKTFIDLLEEYYKYLNQDGLPTREISSIRTLKDIDLVSERYLEKIEELIGKSVPQSNVINRVELYKTIVRYYNTRGSDDSVHAFFKIFFNELVTLFYPKDFLFNTSSGKGAWSSKAIFANLEYDPLIRQVANVIDATENGITFSSKATNGSGNLLSVRFFAQVADQYDIYVDYFKGVTSVKPGEKSRLMIDAVDLFDSYTTYPIADSLNFIGYINGRPKYSEQLNAIEIPFTGSPTRIEWDGTKWIFTIGSALGDLFAFYSEEDVADPAEVVTWIHGWSSIGIPITGSITDITFGVPTNAQLFSALAESDAFSADFAISADVYAAEWTTEYEVTDRFYLSNDPLPTEDIPVGYYAVVNGRKIRPYVIGTTSIVDGEFVWHKDFIETWVYETKKSFASHDYKLFDGYYWQDYSYVIKSNLDADEWLNAYKKFVHPAGLQLFSAISIEMIARNEWYEPLDYNSPDLENNFDWLKSLVPPARLNPNSIGYHTPKYQPGYLRDKVLRYLFAYLLPGIHDESLLRLLILNYSLLLGTTDVQTSFVRRKYQEYEKFIDPCEIGAGWLSKTIAEAEEDFVYTNSCRIHNISTFFHEETIFDYSFYDPEFGEGSGVWSGSSYDTDGGDGSGVWESSSYENL